MLKQFRNQRVSCFWNQLDPDLSNSRALQRGLQQRHPIWEAAALKLVSLDLQGVTGGASWLFRRGSSEKEFKNTLKIVPGIHDLYLANSWDQLFLLLGILFQFLQLWLTKTLCEHNSSDHEFFCFCLQFSHGADCQSDVISERINYSPSEVARWTLIELLQMEPCVIISTHNTLLFHEQNHAINILGCNIKRLKITKSCFNHLHPTWCLLNFSFLELTHCNKNATASLF